jgi:hypothetical protein
MTDMQKMHKELWDIVESYDAKDYVVENIIPLAMQIAGRMEHIADVISPKWKGYVFALTTKKPGQWLFNDLFGNFIAKILKELKKDYATPEALSELMDCVAENVFLTIGGACGKRGGKLLERDKKRVKESCIADKISTPALHWGSMLLLIIAYWEYIWRTCGRDMKLYSYTRSILWLNSALSDLWHNKGDKAKAQEISTEKKNKINLIAKRIWEKNGKIRTMDEANRLKLELEKQGFRRSVGTIYNWICLW